MAKQTSLHAWSVPEDGDSNYVNTFDDLFIDLDEGVEIRDIESNLSNYSPASDAKFFATDTENVFIGDGTSWNQTTSMGKNPTFTSATMGEASVQEGHGSLGLPNHHITYSSGLTDEEIARINLASGDRLELWRLEARIKGGGTDSNVTLDVYDATNAVSLGSVSGGGQVLGGGSPIGTSSGGATILVRMTTGVSDVTLTPGGIVTVVSA